MGASDRDTAAGTPLVLKSHQALKIHAEVQPGASLPMAIAGALRVARRLECTIAFDWQGQEVTCGPEDTYQGVQRKAQRNTSPRGRK